MVRVAGGKVVRGRGVSVNDYVIGGWGCERVVVVGRVVNGGRPAGAMAIARARQENKAGFATRMFDKLRAAKAKMAKGA